jgi:hypothetical protein
MLREVKAASAQKECDARQQEETAQVTNGFCNAKTRNAQLLATVYHHYT